MTNQSVSRAWTSWRGLRRALWAAIVLTGTAVGACTDRTPATGPSSAATSPSPVPLAQARQPAATLTSISPNSGSVLGGTPVTITGTNLPPQSANPTLTIANVPLTQVTVVNGTTMTGVTGPHAAGGPFALDIAWS